MDVDEYTSDPRIRKAFRSLATYGTSQGVAQAVMWRVCNDLPFETMAEQAGKVMNRHEIALAARFVEALDASTSGELVDPSALSSGRVSSSRCEAKGRSAAKPSASKGQLDGLRLLGLPLQVVDSEGLPTASAPAICSTSS